MSSGKNYYNILGIGRDATEAEIKRTYRKLALKYHPDKCKLPDATRKFQEIGEAYSVLSDPSKRRRYDLTFGRGSSFARQDDEFTSSWPSPFVAEDFTVEDAFDVFSDFMYGGDIPDLFREEGVQYHQVDVPYEVAEDGGEVEVYLEREDKLIKLQIDGVFSGKWKPFISLGDNDTAILKVSFPRNMSLAEQRRHQKIFLGYHAISVVTNAIKEHPLLGLLGIGLGVAALVLFKSK